MFVLRELYQRTERTLVNSVNSGDPRVIAFPCYAIRVKASEATFGLALLLVKPLHATVIP
jgi:hypothetical protein